MDPLSCLLNFAAGFFVCYAIPHLASGLLAIPYRNPVGQSAPRANFVWGTLSIIIASMLLEASRFPFNVNLSSILFWLAFILTGFWLSGRRSS